MIPTQPTDGERKVIRWFLLVFAVLTLSYITFVWWQRTQDCQEHCVIKGAEGQLRHKGGGRFNLGNYCECVAKQIRSE